MKFFYVLCLIGMALAKPNQSISDIGYANGRIIGGQEAEPRKYRVSQQVLDGPIGQYNPIGLWWVWVRWSKTTISWLILNMVGCQNHQNQPIFKKTK